VTPGASLQILVLTSAKAAGSPRPNRMIRYLAPEHRLTVLAGGPPDVDGVEFIPLPAPFVPGSFVSKLARVLAQRCGNHRSLIWRPGLHALATHLRRRRFDAIVVHDLHLLPVALAIAGRRSRVVFDAREFFPRQGDDRWVWRQFYRPVALALCRKYLRRAHAVMTVSPGLVKGFRETFGIDCHLIPSLPKAEPLEPSPVAGDSIRMIHHGMAAPGRQLERMIDLMRLLPERFSLDLMLVGLDSAYGRRLQQRARGLPKLRFLPPVEFRSLVRFTNTYDIGLYLLAPTSFNTLHALPNKFFEFIQARLMLAIGPSPDMAAYVREHDLGVVAVDFSPAAMARALSHLRAEDVRRHKNHSHRAAALLHAERLADEVRRLVRAPRGLAAS
jgi:hypothetical protein